jgi:rod shape-determining protein MreC
MAAMESFFTRFKNPLVLIAIVLAQVLALAVQVQAPLRGAEHGFDPTISVDGKNVAMLRRWTVAAVSPLERLTQTATQRVEGAWLDYVDLRHTREQDKQLQLTVARLREEQAAFAEDAAQGRRLQKLLDFREHYISATVAAQVIGTSGSERSRVLYLDKGWADGLRPDQAVITPDGVAGKLRDVFPHTAQVLLINDASSGAGVVLASTRIRAILRGTATGQVQIDNLTADSRIKPGEQVLTSGGDMVYPRGLPVGVIQSIAPDPTHQPYTAITIKPAANLEQLSEVLVITGMQTSLPEAAQDDSAQALAAAQSNQRAADLIAEKLPSLQPPSDAGAANGAGSLNSTAASGAAASAAATGAGAAASAIPKPPPPLHPDHYSPGATPPAADLTPGGTAHTEPPGSAPAPQPGSAKP